ncbi:MAG: prolyl oligopeptidase family serine peptidase [Deltaproteobacteria bacterium]|nr:prolyl oligopeptidase family serine peptidase [Deltaproteobacteria bacterium]
MKTLYLYLLYALNCLIPVSTQSSDNNINLKSPDLLVQNIEESSDRFIKIAPGIDGFFSSRLKLGPFTPTKQISTDLNSFTKFKPLKDKYSSEHVSELPFPGKMESGKKWTLESSSKRELWLKSDSSALFYLFTEIFSEKTQKIYMTVSSPEPITVTLNGKDIFLKSFRQKNSKINGNLFELEVPSGISTIFIKTFRPVRGRWRIATRFLNSDFERVSNIYFLFKNDDTSVTDYLLQTASLKINREIDLQNRELKLRAWLDFYGSKPAVSLIFATLDSLSGKKVITDKKDITIDLSHKHKAYYLLGEYNFKENDIDNIPKLFTLSFQNSKVLKKEISIYPSLLKKLFDISDLFDEALKKYSFDDDTINTIKFRINKYKLLIEKGDRDYNYIDREISKTLKMVQYAVKGVNPFLDSHGEYVEKGYVSKLDGRLHSYALYYPSKWSEESEKLFPLVVILHGLNGKPVAAISSLFGNPHKDKETILHADRFPGNIGSENMFVVAPGAFDNSGYLYAGEEDVVDIISIIKKKYRIDENRIYIAGASMGGTGAARIALHNPGMFAAAASLCGYHNGKLYSSVRNEPILSFEEFLLDSISNIHLVISGRHTPLYLVHGTKDFPLSSEQLLWSYQKEGYRVNLKLLQAKHNVWDETYKNRNLFRFFEGYKRVDNPLKVDISTGELRHGKNLWLKILSFMEQGRLATLRGSAEDDSVISIESINVKKFEIEKDFLIKNNISELNINGENIALKLDENSENLVLTKNKLWSLEGKPAGTSAERQVAQAFEQRPEKNAGLSGPVYDAYNEPLMFVYGTGTNGEASMSMMVAKGLKIPRWGMSIEWPLKADVEVTIEDIQNYSLVVIGTVSGNSILKRISSRLPFIIKDNQLNYNNKSLTGDDFGVSFIYPNPLNPKRYVVVHTASTVKALFGALNLPMLLPDFVVYESSKLMGDGGYIFGKNRPVIDGGFFNNNWQFEEIKQ